MNTAKLKLHSQPEISNATLLLGFSGWMDGGDVSTGAIEYLAETLHAEKLAHIDSAGFYIYNFPGTMEITAMFRPHTRIEDGLVLQYDLPENVFYCVPDRNLILFSGKEPNLAWEEYADCLYSLCTLFGVRQAYFLGSVGGTTPHTREPRVAFSASNEELRDKLKGMGLSPSAYEGPASIVTYLTSRAPRENIAMASMVAEIPAYIQGYNPRCVETMLRLIGRLLGMQFDLDALRSAAELYQSKVDDLVSEQEELAEKVKELERDYDKEAFDREMTDLKGWTGDQGLKVE